MNRRGFTLIEVLVAISITALLLTTIYGVFTSVSAARERLEMGGEGYHQARVLFDRIGRELRGTWFLPANAKTRFEGGLTEDQYPFIELSTTATTPQGGLRGGVAVVRYELRPDPEAPAQEREEDAPQVLLRREYNLFDTEGETRSASRLATGVRELKFRFYDGAEWLENWQGRSSGLPQLVEVTLQIPIAGQAVPFRSVFEVPVVQ